MRRMRRVAAVTPGGDTARYPKGSGDTRSE
jgi:hypothetical protein